MTVTAPRPTPDRDLQNAGSEPPLLEIRDLAVRFELADGDVWAVNGVDLSVRAGEVFALVGESGSGKSVSMLSVMGLLPVPPARVTGSIKFSGRELTALSGDELSEIRGGEIGMVFQDPMSSLNPVHRVGKQIAENIRLHERVSRKEASTRAVALLDRVGIPNARRRSRDHPHEFSGGMRQRAMVAMALACNPKLLIADEPTTALDVTVQRQIVSLVEELKDDLGMAVVWITHDLGVVAELADRVAVMYGGRLMETGVAEDIYRSTQHPYTAGLLRSIPSLDTPTDVQLPEIPGTPAPLREQLTSCPFHSRCPMGQTDCRDGVPQLRGLADGDAHLTACVHAEEMEGVSKLWPMESLASERQAVYRASDVVVELRGLRVYYPSNDRRGRDVRAVDGVDLEIRHGQTLGIVGESGCGKSTLGRAMVGLAQPQEPAITLRGNPLDTSRGAHRRAIQMIFQDPFSSMNPGMKVADVITEPMRIHGIGSAEDRRSRAIELLAEVGLAEEAADRYPHEFSGGQRQRIAIARALAAEPEVIVCDEPVSALDVSVQAQIINLLKKTQEETDVSLVFIAHDLAVVRHISSEIAVMYLGQVVERSARDDLYENPLHPYTQALLAAVPEANFDAAIGERQVLEGDLPDPADPPAGCRFHTRCPMAVDGLCNVDVPPLREVIDGRWVACHLVQNTSSGPVLSPTEGVATAPEAPAKGGSSKKQKEKPT